MGEICLVVCLAAYLHPPAAVLTGIHTRSWISPLPHWDKVWIQPERDATHDLIAFPHTASASQALEGFGSNPRTELLTSWEHSIPVSF